MTTDTGMVEPTPGSDTAIKAGCTCPVLDNGHGRGWMGMAGVYVYTVGCPIHGHVFDDSPFKVIDRALSPSKGEGE